MEFSAITSTALLAVHTVVSTAKSVWGLLLNTMSAGLFFRTALLGWLIYLVTVGIYNRYLHPLRVFPGPFWASVTNFWKLWICLTKEMHTRGVDYHAKYGPVIRIAPNLLVFDDPKLLPKVYHRYADKTDFYSAGILGKVTPPFQTKGHREHAAKRKRIASSFQMSNLKKLESDIDEAIAKLMKIFEVRFVETGKNIDISEWVKWFAYDTVSNMAFGKSIGFVENGNDVGGLIQAFYDMAPMAGLVAALPNIVNPLLENSVTGRWLMPTSGDGTGIGKVMKYRDNMLEKRLETRHALQHGDFLDNIMNAKNADGSYMTVEEVKVEALVLMVAATDTSAAFISPFVHNVIQNSHIYARLREEITLFEQQGKLPTGIVTYEQTLELPYFMACVKETLRFSPSTPIIMPRLVSSGGMEIEGHWVPAGTEIGANPYVVHRSTDIFGEDAHEFHPERWLVSEEHSKEMDKHMMAWGYGARVCLGKNIAQLTTQKLCLELFRRFDLGTQDVDNPWRAENWGIMVYWDQWLSIKAAALAST